MANEQSGVKFFVILTILCLASQPCVSQDDDVEESPFLSVMQSLLKDSSKGQNSGLSLLAPMLQGLMQNGGVKQLGDLLGGGAGKKSNPTLSLLSGLGSLLQARKSGSEGEGAGFDPAMLGTFVDLFASLSEAQNIGKSADKAEKKEVKSSQKKDKDDESDNGMDWEPVLGVVGNVVSSMMAGGNGRSNDGGGMEQLLGFLPVIMSSLGGRHMSHSSDNVKHHDHPTFLPPFFENIHEYWDHFTTSQFGRALWENSGLAALAAQFQDEKGNFVPTRVFESLENNVFRRRWIKAISSFVAEWANHVSDAETQKKYLETVQVVANSFLQTEGYPKSALLNLKKPGESISALADEVFSRQLSLQVNSAQYVKPAIYYFQEIFTSTQKAGLLSGLTAQTIESKLSKTLEAQLIEPVLRANRAYRFALKNKKCAKYVLCVVEANESRGIKPAVIKAANLVSAWFLTTPTNTPFYELVTSASDGNCGQYNNDCSDFNEEDSKATTEYFHNEL